MKKIITRTLSLLCAGLFAGVLLTGCEGDTYYEDGTDMWTDQFTVLKDHWVWNERYERYEYIRDWNEIDEYMYEEGVVNCGVFITELTEDGRDKYEVLRSLPFVHSYADRFGTYTQTIGYDIAYGSNNRYIAFYIQASDLSGDRPAVDNYTFKITLFWRK